MKLGIIGLPGAGKSTLFEALTGIIQDDAPHKPEDRIGTITVPDQRVDILKDMYNPKKTIHARVEYLLPYIVAHDQGRKKEETAWTTVRACDAIIHVVRNFKGYGQEAPQPLKDFATMNEEMIFTDLMVVEKRLERLEIDAKRGREVNLEEMQLLKQCKELLDNDTPLRARPELAAEHLLKGFTFLSARPMLVVFNNADDDDALPDVGEILQNEKCLVVRCSLEHELAGMQADEAQEYLEEYGITTSAMDLMISFSYELLGLISFFTVGEDEVRAWTIRKNIDAVDAAEVIHSDIKKGFIRAEVVAYNDLMEAGSRNEAKKKGTVRLEGKTYKVQDGDIIEFRFNV